VGLLTGHFRKVDERYHGEEGDRFAFEELQPVAHRFVRRAGWVLEVGCGYGRNLVALSQLPARLVVGCDVARDELAAARSRLARPDPERTADVGLVEQEPYRLPFRDGSFDLVVLWQVLEHVFSRDEKKRVLAECVRVLRAGGYLLIETPNAWFPVDYHDNRVPFAHWLPRGVREELTFRVRGKRYEPSQYMSLRGYERLIREIAAVRRLSRATRFYFAPSYLEAWGSVGGTNLLLKRMIFVAVAPLHAVLSAFGSTADLVLPSVRMVWNVEKRS
jgi:SAM-dependent methyltransferase